MNRIECFLLGSVISGIILFTAFNCSKEKDVNNTNGRTTALFNDELEYGTLTDQDGNIYKTITIGNQVWMAENLRTTKYNDGTAIPNVTGKSEWCALTTGAYCNYNNTKNVDTISTYGRIYNWYAVNTGKLAPPGWHVPNDEDWRTLTDYLGGELPAGGKLKEKDTTHWLSPNTGADNSSGFTALPAGARCFWEGDSIFGGMGWSSIWWSTDLWYGDVWIKLIVSNHSNAYLHAVNLENNVYGFSVRCLKD